MFHGDRGKMKLKFQDRIVMGHRELFTTEVVRADFPLAFRLIERDLQKTTM